MKEYFSHDYNARSDTKLVKVFMKHGLAGIGAYWCIVEMLYEESGYLLRSEYERIAFELRTDFDTIKSIVENYDLFTCDNDKFWSESALTRLKARMTKSEKARQSVQKRWQKYERNTNVEQPNNDGNTSKVKESKVKESIEEIYNTYPSKCIIRGASNGKSSQKNKEKIKSLLKIHSKDHLIKTINWYIEECRTSNTYMKNFGTFLNNLPDISTDRPKENTSGVQKFKVKFRTNPREYVYTEKEIKAHEEKFLTECYHKMPIKCN